MAAFIIRAKYGENFTYTTTPYFSDVPSDSWAFKYVQKLKDERITTLSGTYLAGSVVTREQMAAFIGRAFLGMGTPSDTPSILDSAVFYKGPRPAPSNVTFINPRGDSVTMLAYPGQVYISVVPRTDVATVQALVNQYGGVILSRIPALGLYLIQVPVGNEGNFISQIRQNPIVLNASPNPLLKLQEYALVDLSDTGKEPNELVVALLSSPDPNARVILAQLDDFVDPHGNNVQAVRESITGIQDSLRVHVGNLPCSLPTALCSSGDQALRGLTAIIAGAEINRQKVDINMSWGVNPATSDPSQFSTTNGAGANSWAVNEWEVYFRQTLDTLLASDWVKNGNVILNKSADNGAVLRDANGNVLDQVGIDITDAINRLRNDSRYGSIMNDVVTIYGAVNPDGTLASYSNLGPSVIYDIPPSDPGTSYVAPKGQGATYVAWTALPDLSASQINRAVRTSANTNSNGLDILDVAGTLNEARRIAGVSYCGDGTCNSNLGETTTTCPSDCRPQGYCGDGICDPNLGETTNTCPGDCPLACGDNFCNVAGGELQSCPQDCPQNECCVDTNGCPSETPYECGASCCCCGWGQTCCWTAAGWVCCGG